RLPAVTDQQTLQLVARDACEDGRVRDLVTVEVEDGQDGAIDGRVQELVRVPGGGQRSGLGFAIADHTRHDEVRIVEGGAKSMRQRIAELAAFVDGAGDIGRAVAWNP